MESPFPSTVHVNFGPFQTKFAAVDSEVSTTKREFLIFLGIERVDPSK